LHLEELALLLQFGDQAQTKQEFLSRMQVSTVSNALIAIDRTLHISGGGPTRTRTAASNRPPGPRIPIGTPWIGVPNADRPSPGVVRKPQESRADTGSRQSHRHPCNDWL